MLAGSQLIKSEKWWNDKAPPVLGLAYFLLAVSDVAVPLGHALVAMAAFMTAFIGVAGFGHVINDLCDLDYDRAAAKPNTMQRKTALQRALVLLLFLVVAWVPWLVLPANRWNLSLIVVQLLLLTGYAVPPLRLKTRAVPAVVADAFYAYTVPALITWTTFGASAVGSRPFVLTTLIVWSFCAGLRGILNHQRLDADNDASAGLTTFATRYGRARTLRVLSQYVVPAETAGFVGLTVAFSLDLRLYPVGVLLYLGWRSFQLAYLWDAPPALPWRLNPEQVVTQYGYRFLGDFYTSWFPVLMLAALSWRQPVYLTLAAAHLVLFENGVVHLFHVDLKHIPRGVAKMTKRMALP